MRLKRVSDLRADIANRQLDAKCAPGFYIWWFDTEGMKEILKPLSGIEVRWIASRKIGGKDYYALYFGISKDLKGRIRWHVAQKHTASSAKHGFISTLRHTLGALLGLPMVDSEQAVNRFIDKHCMLEYENCATLQEAEEKETATLKSGYYPLNISKNVGVPATIVSQLKAMRKRY